MGENDRGDAGVPPIRQFPDRALRWLLQSPANLRGLLLAAYPEAADRVDYSRVREVPATFILESFREREADIVRKAPYRSPSGESEVWIYVLVEHQSTPDRLMPFRLLLAMVQLWEMERRDQAERKIPEGEQQLSTILPVVFYTGRREWAGPGPLSDLVDVPDELRSFVPKHEVVYLDVARSPESRLTTGGEPFGWALRLLQEEQSDLATFEQVERGALQVIRQLWQGQDLERGRVLLRFLVALVHHRRAREEQEELMNVARRALVPFVSDEEVSRMAKTYGEELIEEGMAKGIAVGRERGRAEGQAEGKQSALLAILRARFGALRSETEAEVSAITDLARLDELLAQVLGAKSVEDLGLGRRPEAPGHRS